MIVNTSVFTSYFGMLAYPYKSHPIKIVINSRSYYK